MTKEIWVPAKGFEDLYAVSSLGNIIRTKKYNNSKGPLKPQLRSGYFKVSLSRDSKPCQMLLHRLVADSFWGIPEGMVINHLNGIRTDNRLENLEICTMTRNEWHKRHILRKNARPSFTKLSVEKAAEIRQQLADGNSGKSLAARYGVCESTISQIRKGIIWAAPY